MAKYKDLSGQKFNMITLVSLHHRGKWGEAFWLGKCDCGNAVVVRADCLKNGNNKSCGCLRFAKTKESIKDFIGMKFGRWLVISFDKTITKQNGKYGNIVRYWNCKCECGTERSVLENQLKCGNSESCGCLQKELLISRSRTHGFSKTPKGSLEQRFYSKWAGMLARCNNPDDAHYPRYGGRGIVVCKRWLKFENFRDDMWKSYLKHVKEFGTQDTSLDRFPNNSTGNYEPSNCRWATLEEQSSSMRSVPKTLNKKEHKWWIGIIQGVARRIMHGKIKFSKYTYYFGISIQEFRDYVESLWEPWMSWDNYGEGVGKWNLDHIKRCNQFDLSKEKDRLECFNYLNYRPFDSIANGRRSKSCVEVV